MTKKDYMKMAKLIRDAKNKAVNTYKGKSLITASDCIQMMQEKMIVMLQNDNSQFNVDEFTLNCEIE